MNNSSRTWQSLYNQVPLCDVPRHFASMRTSPFLMQYLMKVLEYCPRGGRSCETGIGTGYSAIWLSLRGITAEGFDYVPGIVERARQVNNILEGHATFAVGDLFDLYETVVAREGRPATAESDVLLLPGSDFPFPGSGVAGTNRLNGPVYDVVYHQGVLEHFTVPQMHAALAQQIACARYVVFSVPSVYYTDSEIGDERLLPIEEWKLILEPFDVVELEYYGHPQSGDHDHIMCVLRGQPVDDGLLKMMHPGTEPYPEGISAIVHARNEERHMAECLETLRNWTDEIIVCDMESSDATVEIASRFTDKIIAHPLISNFDRSRNVSAMRAKYRWVFYLDADERVPEALGRALRDMSLQKGDSFEGLLVPFKHHFAGHWMQCLYPGYTAPRLFKNGHFVFNARLHSGAQVDGHIDAFPADDPEKALVHYSFDSMAHYLTKLNRYTDGEATNMHKDGQMYHWQNAVRHFVNDFQSYYDQGAAHRDGVHGFIYSFLSAFYRFEQHAKLYEQRFIHGQVQTVETQVPASVEQMLEFALSVVREQPVLQAQSLRVAPIQDSADPGPAVSIGLEDSDDEGPAISVSAESDSRRSPDVVWSGPVFDPSGYGEEIRNFIAASEVAGLRTTAHFLPWSRDEVILDPERKEHLHALAERSVAPGFVQIVQNFPTGYSRHPQASIAIGRTMFETDRLPREWVKGCNTMDYIWVPSEFNRRSFAAAGVLPKKLVVMPGCFDTSVWQDEPVRKPKKKNETFRFLTIFDWTLHKGWDVLLRSFLQTFKPEDKVELVFKVWSTMGYNTVSIREQAARFAQEEFGHDLIADRRIRFIDERLSAEGMRDLYREADSFVLPSRGEGWGRPYMEAMAAGLPVIGTNWSGNTAFMTQENSYLLDCEVLDVPDVGWREIPTYRGHRWAEPNGEQLGQIMLELTQERSKGVVKGRVAREEVISRFSHEAVGELISTELERITAEREPVAAVTKSERTGSPLILPESCFDSEKESGPIAVRWEGDQFQWHSLAHVNREYCLGLEESGRVKLSIVTDGPSGFRLDDDPRFAQLAECWHASLDGPAAVHVRHQFPPRLQAPPEGHFVLIQPWEYGYLPKQWLDPIRQSVSEVWCYSEYVREVYRASGIEEEKLHVVPLGVDAEVFSPEAPPYAFTVEPGAQRFNAALARIRNANKSNSKREERPFVFLFAGGTIHRKGFDILLEAYTKAFSAYDNVCLLVKDTGTQTVYRDHNHRERIIALSEDPSRPAFLYVDDDLSSHQLAGIYTASDCLVMPYRGEGFLLPALEAMSCGVPVIVTGGGSTDDFVDEEVGWRIPAEKKPYGSNRVGEWDFCGPAWQFEVDPEDLARTMRQAYMQRDEVRRRGAAAAQRVKESWTWRDASEAALSRVEILSRKPVQTAPAIVPASAASRNPNKVANAAETTARRDAPTLSLCMIVRNEERVLDACLTSIKPWVDEIVVVDTGSTDKTVEIAESHGVKLLHFPWTDSFSEARNISLDAATGDWVMWMDADDTIPEECGRQLKQIILTAEERTTGFLMQVHIPPAPGENGFTIVDHVKIFRNWPELRFEGRIHEQILEPIYRVGGRVERTDLYVVHSGYDYSVEGQQGKRERDITLLEKDLADRPDHPFVLFNIGMTAYHLKDYDKARPALERCLEKSQPHESTVRKVYAMLAGCELEQGRPDVAKDKVERGLQHFPHDPELLFRAGIIYREVGDLPAAERSYVKLLTERETGHIDSLDVSMTGYKAHHNLALIYQDMARWNEAERAFRAAVTDNPTFVPSWLGLGELYLRMQHPAGAQEVGLKLSELAPEVGQQFKQRLTATGR